MFPVTAKSTDQEIDEAIFHKDMRKEAKDCIAYERARQTPKKEPVLEFHVINRVSVLMDPVLGYALVNDSPKSRKESDLIFDVSSVENALGQWAEYNGLGETNEEE